MNDLKVQFEFMELEYKDAFRNKFIENLEELKIKIESQLSPFEIISKLYDSLPSQDEIPFKNYIKVSSESV